MPQLNYSLASARSLLAGLIAYGLTPDRTISRLAGGGVAQVTTVQVTGAVNSAVHSLLITYDGNTETVSITADGSATVNEVAAALEAAIDANPNLGGLFVAGVSTDTITLTGRVPGLAWITTAGGSLTATITDTTAAASATAIPFGRGVVQRESYPHECLLPSTANDTLKVVHATPTATNSATYDVAVSFDLGDGQGRRTVTASYTADGSATVQEIVEALQVKLDSGFPANSIAVTEDDAKIIFTSEVPNLDFVVTATASTTAWTVTVATEIVPLRFLGVSVYSASVPQDANGTTAYQGGDALSILTNGEIAVELDAGITPSVGDPVWCRASASGSEVLGAFRDAQDAADCIYIPNAQWVDGVVEVSNGVRLSKLRLLDGRI
jgi:phage tail sheath gpL-like